LLIFYFMWKWIFKKHTAFSWGCYGRWPHSGKYITLWNLTSRKIADGRSDKNVYGTHYVHITLNRKESGRFGALKSDSTHHFFRNACTKSGSLRFSHFSVCWLILSVYHISILIYLQREHILDISNKIPFKPVVVYH
jgi:hypothetical protein